MKSSLNSDLSNTEKMMLISPSFQDQDSRETNSDLEMENLDIIDEIKNKLDQIYLAHKSRSYLVKEISYYFLNKK
jgi:hypothetical protein